MDFMAVILLAGKGLQMYLWELEKKKD